MATATHEPRSVSEAAEARIEQVLDAAGGLLKGRELSSGMLWSCSALFIGAAALVASHAIFRPSIWAGTAILAILGLSVAIVVSRALLRPLFVRINPYYSARTIEASIPDCRNSVINWLDLRHQTMPAAIRGAVINRAARDIEEVDVNEAVNSLPRPKFAAILFATSAVLLVVLVFLLGPGAFASALTRGLTPWTPRAVVADTGIEIIDPQGGDGSVAVGRDMAIRVKLSGKVPDAGAKDAATLWVWNAAGQAPVGIPMTIEPGRSDGTWIGAVSKDLVQMGFWYKVTAGDNQTVDHRVEVRLDLFIQSITTRVEPPAYLRLDPIEGNEPGLAAIKGSKVTLLGSASDELRSAELVMFAGLERRAERIKATINPEDSKRFSVNLSANESGQYHLRVVSKSGDPFETTLAPLTVTDDQKPSIVRILPDPSKSVVELRLVDAQDFQFQVNDDFGLASVSAHLALPDGRKVPLKAGGLPSLPGNKPVSAATGTWTVRAAELGEFAGKSVKIVVAARDSRPNDAGLIESSTELKILKNSTEVRVLQPSKTARVKPGQSLDVIAEITGTIPEAGNPDSPRLQYRALGDNGPPKSIALRKPTANKSRWIGTIPAESIGEGGWLQVLAGDGASALVQVEVSTPLKLTGFVSKVDPPPYMKGQPLVSRERPIQGVAGSKANITLETNVPGVEGGIFFRPEGGAERELRGSPDFQNPRNLDVALPLDKPGAYRIVIKGEGNTWRDMGTFPVEVVEDKPPTVELVEPTDGASVPVNGQVLARIKASDDWGLKSLALKLEWLSEGAETPLRPVPLAIPTGESGPSKKFEGLVTIKLSDLVDGQGQALTLAAGQKLRLAGEARDHHPDPTRTGQSASILLNLAPPANDAQKREDEKRDKEKMDQFQRNQQKQDENNKNAAQPMAGGNPEQGMNPGDKQENKPGQNGNPMGDKPMPGVNEKPMPDQANQPMPGQNPNNMPPEIKDVERRIQEALQEKNPMPGQGNQPMPMPGQGNQPMPMPGQGNQPMPMPMPGQGNQPMPIPMPGQGNQPMPMPGQGNQPMPMPGQGNQPMPMPGQGNQPMPMPGQGNQPMPMPGQGNQPMPMPGQGNQPMPMPMPGQGNQPMPMPMPGQGNRPMPMPMPGQGNQPMPGQGNQPMPMPMPGQGNQPMPMPGQGSQPMPGQGNQPMPMPMPGQGNQPMPMPGQGNQPMPGQGNQPMPMPGQGNQPMPGQGNQPMPMPMPGQGNQPMPMPGQGNQPMPGQGNQPMPMPGQGNQPMPGQGNQPMPMPGQGNQPMPMPGQGNQPMPMPGQGNQPMPGQGNQPMPGQGNQPMPGQGNQPMPTPGQGNQPMPMPVQGNQPMPMPGQGNQPMPMPGQGNQPMPGQGNQPMPGQGNQPMPGQGNQPMPMPGQGNQPMPMPGQGNQPMPMPGQGNQPMPMPGQGNQPMPMPGQGNQPMPGQGNQPMPGQGNQPMPMPGQGNQPMPMPGQGNQPMPMPGQGNQPMPMPGQGNQPMPMPGQGNQPMPGQGNQPMPMPGQGNQPMPMPGQGNQPMPMPGQGNQPMPMPGQGNQPMPMPGQGNQPMPGQGNQPMPMPGQGNQPMPMPGQGNQPMRGQGNQPMPMPGQGNQPMPGGGANDQANAPGMNPTAEDNRGAVSGSREKPDAIDPANGKASLAQLESLQDQVRRNKEKLKQQGISDEEIRKYEEYLKNRREKLEQDSNRPDTASPQQASGLQSVGVRKARTGTREGAEAGTDNRPPPPVEYQDAWREFSRKRKLPADPKLR